MKVVIVGGVAGGGQRGRSLAQARRVGGDRHDRAHGLCVIRELRPAVLRGRRHHRQAQADAADARELQGAL